MKRASSLNSDVRLEPNSTIFVARCI